jgi:hypothetical protein
LEWQSIPRANARKSSACHCGRAGRGLYWYERRAVAAQAGRSPMSDVEHVSVTIARPPAEVYAFASDPRNLPRWAAGLARSDVRQDGEEWIADAPFGRVRVRFAERNAFGVLDHDVTLASGVTVHNPMRVLPHGEGSEFVFTVMRRPEVSEDEFARDVAAVEKDLATLKELLERDAKAP